MFSLRDKLEVKKIDKYFVYLLCLNIALIIVFALLEQWLGFNLLDSGRFEVSDFRSGFAVFSIGAVIFVPFFEELVHRSYVSKRINVLWSVLFLAIYFMLISDFSITRILIFSLYFVFLISIVIFDRLYRNKSYLLANSTLFFVMFHVFKFNEFHSEKIISLLLSLFPQLISGIALFFIHRKYGFFGGVVFHSLINASLLGAIYTSIILFEEEMSASLIADLFKY